MSLRFQNHHRRTAWIQLPPLAVLWVACRGAGAGTEAHQLDPNASDSGADVTSTIRTSGGTGYVETPGWADAADAADATRLYGRAGDWIGVTASSGPDFGTVGRSDLYLGGPGFDDKGVLVEADVTGSEANVSRNDDPHGIFATAWIDSTTHAVVTGGMDGVRVFRQAPCSGSHP